MVGTGFIAGTHVDWFRMNDPHDERGLKTIPCDSQVDGFKQGFFGFDYGGGGIGCSRCGGCCWRSRRERSGAAISASGGRTRR